MRLHASPSHPRSLGRTPSLETPRTQCQAAHCFAVLTIWFEPAPRPSCVNSFFPLQLFFLIFIYPRKESYRTVRHHKSQFGDEGLGSHRYLKENWCWKTKGQMQRISRLQSMASAQSAEGPWLCGVKMLTPAPGQYGMRR